MEKDNPFIKNESAESLEPAAKEVSFEEQEAERRWRQFVQQELDRIQNEEKIKQKSTSDPSIASIIEQIPIKTIIESAVSYLKKIIDPKQPDITPKKSADKPMKRHVKRLKKKRMKH